MPRAFAFPLALLTGAALLGTGAWLFGGGEIPVATPGVTAGRLAGGLETGVLRPIPPARTGFDPANTDYGPPPGVIDPPAGHAGRHVPMDEQASVSGSD